MCFDIDVDKLSLEELRDNLRRINMLLSKPTVVNNLPDKGHQLRLAKQKLEKEIKFREGLEETRKQIQKMSIRCASEADIFTPHSAKLCSVEKKPERERFRPHLSVKPTATGRTASMKDLYSGAKLINLTSSLTIQIKQEERVKDEQVKAKQDRLLTFLKQNDSDDSDSDETLPDINLSDSASENDKEEANNFYFDDEPSTSGLGKRKKPKQEPNQQEKEIKGSAVLKAEIVKSEKQSKNSEEVLLTDAVATEVKVDALGSGQREERPDEVSNADFSEPRADSTQGIAATESTATHDELNDDATDMVLESTQGQHIEPTGEANKDCLWDAADKAQTVVGI